jgi:hypothetical protein
VVGGLGTIICDFSSGGFQDHYVAAAVVTPFHALTHFSQHCLREGRDGNHFQSDLFRGQTVKSEPETPRIEAQSGASPAHATYESFADVVKKRLELCASDGT